MDRRLRALGRPPALPIPGGSGRDPHLPDPLRAVFADPMDRARSGQAGEDGARSGITKRNGIWVLTIGGAWRGDYRTRAQAEAAAAGTQAKHP
jgi:hypothetical protein